jgi:hypothetical protein
MAATLFRVPAYDYRTRRRRFVPFGVPFPYNRATEKYVRTDIAGPYDAYSLADTDSTVGNYIVYERVCIPSGVEVFVDSDLIPFTVDPSTGRQSFRYREWISSTKTWLPVNGVAGDYTTYYVNNATPTAVGTIPNQQAYTNIAWEGPILDDYITDAEGDAITWTVNSGVLPTGITVQSVTLNVGLPGERTVKRLRGTPATGQEGTDTIVMRGTDIVGAFVNLAAFNIVTGIGQQMPNVIDAVLATGLASIAAVMTSSTVTIQAVIDPLVTVGHIKETQPVAGTWIPPGSPVLVTFSADLSPDAFSFADQTNVSQSTVITSSPITIAGIDFPTDITVSGGEYSINAGAFTSNAGMVALGDTVRARHTSSALTLTATNTLVTIGGVSDTFTSTTAAIIIPTPAQVTVRAYRLGHFGGLYRVVGEEFEITTPYEYSPYWMTLIDTPPVNWTTLLEPFVPEIDRQIATTFQDSEQAQDWVETGIR